MKTYEVKLTLVVGVDEKPGVDTRLRVSTMLVKRLTFADSCRVDSVTELQPMKVEAKP